MMTHLAVEISSPLEVQCPPACILAWAMNLPKPNSPKNKPANTAKKYPTFNVITAIILHESLAVQKLGREYNK